MSSIGSKTDSDQSREASDSDQVPAGFHLEQGACQCFADELIVEAVGTYHELHRLQD